MSKNNIKFDTSTINSCDSFIYGNEILKQSGKYTYKYIGSSFNDSFYTIELTINQSQNIKSNHFTCQSYSWQDSLYSKSGIYTRHYKTNTQCDSILTLDLKIGINNKINLSNGTNYTALQDSVKYQWYRCYPFRKIANETKRSFHTTTKGSYAVVLDNSKGCVDTSDCIALNSSSVLMSTQANISIFPNPFNSNLTIEFDEIQKEINVKIYDIAGKLAYSTQFSKLATCDLRLEALPKGSYYIKVETDFHSQYFNIIKE